VFSHRASAVRVIARPTAGYRQPATSGHRSSVNHPEFIRSRISPPA